MAYNSYQQQQNPIILYPPPPSPPPSLPHYYYYNIPSNNMNPFNYNYTYYPPYEFNYNMVPYHDLHNQYPSYGSRPTSHGFCPHDHHMSPQPRPLPPPGSGGRLSERLSSFVKGATVGRLVHEAVVFVAGKVCLDDGGDLINFDTSFYDDLIMNR
ncbi:hypothetical protein CsatB_015314 [Cannabis sativa]